MNYYTWCFAVPVPKEKAEETTGYCSDEESLKNQTEGVTETNAPIVEIDWELYALDADNNVWDKVKKTKLPIEKLGNRPLGNEKQMANAIIISWFKINELIDAFNSIDTNTNQ